MKKFLLQISLAFVTIFSISDSITAQCPTINSQPVSQYDCEDNSIRMIVGVTGSPTFQWQRKLPSETTFSNIAGATLDNYQVYQQIFTQAPTGTQYKVVLSANSCANVTSNPATITYHTFESIINDPVCVGKNYALTIPITATSQSYVSGYQWERLVSGGVWTTAVNSGSLSGVTTATLNFSNIPQIEDGVKYRCNVVFQVSPNNDNNGSVTNSDQIPTCPRTSPEASIQIKSLSPIPIPTSLIIKGCLGGGVTSVTKTLKSAGCTGTTRWYTQANALIGSSTTGDLNVTQTATGLYYYYATCDQNGCESTKSADVELQINAFPVAPTNAGTPTTACQGDNVIFKASGGTYNIWYSTPVTGGLISTAQTITVNNVQPTNASTAAILTRYVSQKVTSTTCESLTRTKIDVTVNPITAIVTQPTNLTICEGGTASFTLSATGVGLNYQWKKGAVDIGTNSSTLTFTNVNISESGTYTCIVTGTCGTITSNSVSLTVTAKPAAPTVLSPLNYCQNATNVTLSATGSGLLWYNAATGGTGNVSPPTPSTIAVTTQSFWVSQTVSSCESPRSKIDVTITENPTASAGLGATITGTQLYSLSGTTTAQSGTPPYTYAWSSTPVVTISPNAVASNPSFGTFTQNTQINLTIYDSKGCTSNSSANVIVQNCNLAVSIAGNTDFCEGATTTLTANVSSQNGTVLYQWKKATTDLGTVSTQTVSDAGNYSVNITDSFCTANASVIITKTSPPTPVASGASGCVNAAVSLSATNCMSGTLLWFKATDNTSVTMPLTVGNVAENYYAKCKIGTCESPKSNVVALSPTTNTSPTLSFITEKCLSAASILPNSFTPNGGVFSISPSIGAIINSSTGEVTFSQSGTYNITYSVTGSCATGSAQASIIINPPPTASAGLGATITGTQLYSLSGTTTAQSGTPPYTYAWSSTPVVTISPNAVASNPSFGTFTQNTQINLTVYDSKGCSSNSSANVIVQNCNLAVSIAGNTDFCEGATTTLTANVSNQNGTVLYQWKKGTTDLGTVSTQTVSDAGNYSVNITDSFCTANASVIITKTSPPTPVASGASGCVNAAVSLSATNCMSGTLLWFKATDNTSVTMPLTVGNVVENYYTKCKIGICESPKSNVVALSPTTNTSPTLSFITEKCLSATPILPNSFTPNGGVFSISPSIGAVMNSSTGEITFSQSGTYNITYSVTGSCATGSAQASIIINPPPTASAGLGATITGTQLYSLSGITTAQSGTPPYTYAWSSTPVVTISPNATASNPSFGTFTQNTQINLTVYDSKGCTSNSSANVITQACSLMANITSTGSLCSIGNSSMILTANLTGGIAPISYSWKRGATIIGSNSNVTISEPDTYLVIITDANGCSETVSSTVTQNSLAAPQVAGVTIRGSGTATLIATNCTGTSVNWYNANGQFLLNGFSYTTAEITSTTRYYAECVGSGCVSSQTPVDVIFVSAPNSPQVSSALVCGAGSATISTSGCSGEIRWYYAQTATTYFATGGSVFFPNVTSTFDVYAECVVNDTPSPRSRGIITFRVPPVAWIQVIGNQAICKGQSVTLRSNNDSNVKAYLWKKDGIVLGKNDRDLVVTETGNYTVVNSGDGCSSESSAQKVDVIALPNTPTISSTKTMICQGDSTTISGAVSGISFGKNWYKDDIIFSNKNTITINKSGEYKLAFTNYLGCESAQSTAIKISILPVPTKPSIAIIGQAKFCEGTMIELVSELATAYEWRNVKGDIFKTKNIVSISKSDTYFLKTKNSDGCTSAENSQEITVLPLPEKPVIKTEGNQEVCQGESLKIIAQKDANSYVWSTGENSKNITIKGVKAGIISYSLKVTDGNNCTSQPSDLLSVTVNPLPAKPVISNNKNLAICAGESIELQSSLATKYEWNTGEKTQKISTQQTGKYTLKVSNDKGCFSENADSIAVIQNPKPAKPTITTSGATTFCSDTNVVLTSSVSDRYKWISSEKTPNLKVNKSGQYALTVFNQFGCESDISEIITVKVNPQPNRPNITPSAYVEFCEDKSITLTTTKNAKYLWSTGSTESSIEVKKSDKFWVKVSNEFGCQSEASPFLVTTVFALPATPSLDFSGVYNFKALSTTPGKGYEWKLEQNLLSDTTGIIKLNQNGIYSVRRASVFGVIPTVGFAYEELVCYSLPVSKTYNQNADFGGMAVYPNPVQNDYFLLETSDNLIDATITLINNKGEIYYEGAIPKLNKTYRLDIRNIPNGNYLIVLKASDFNAIKHLMISR